MAWLSFWRAFHGRRRRRLGLGTGGAIVGLLLVGAAGAAQIPTTGTLRVVWEQDLPPYPSGPAMDGRWAGDNTVYLAWIKEGITETALDGKFSRLRTLVADPLRWMRDFEILATSKEYLVASARFNTLLFRPAKGKPGGSH